MPITRSQTKGGSIERDLASLIEAEEEENKEKEENEQEEENE